MNKKMIIGGAVAVLLLLVIVILAITSLGGEKPVETTSASMVLTAAAETASYRMTEIANSTPSALPATATLEPSATISATAVLTPTVTFTSAPAQTGLDKLEYVADITVPDGTTFTPGTAFTKTWRLMNQGTTTWNSAYSMVFFDGSQMGGASPIPLTVDVAPGATVDLSVNLVAPSAAGLHTGYWMLRNASQKLFGLGPNADQPFYVQINVAGDAASPTPTTGTPVATPTATSAAAQVSNAAISVDQASFSGACPHTFNFTATFDLNKDATVTYQLEADTGFTITLPSATTASLTAGSHTVTYALEFSDTLSGWARFYVSAPNTLRSDQVTFSLTCQ